MLCTVGELRLVSEATAFQGAETWQATEATTRKSEALSLDGTGAQQIIEVPGQNVGATSLGVIETWQALEVTTQNSDTILHNFALVNQQMTGRWGKTPDLQRHFRSGPSGHGKQSR